MTNIQAFILAFVVLTIQTITLIVLGFTVHGEGVGTTSMLFLALDLGLCACAIELKIIKEK